MVRGVLFDLFHTLTAPESEWSSFSCEVGLVKPEPEIFALALERIGLAAAECLFVGDGGANELAGARSAGLRTVFVPGAIAEHWPDVIEARIAGSDHHVTQLEELLALPLPWAA